MLLLLPVVLPLSPPGIATVSDMDTLRLRPADGLLLGSASEATCVSPQAIIIN